MIDSIVLINPPSKRLGDDKVATPLGILYIASYVRDVVKYPFEFIDFTGGNEPKIPPGRIYYGFTSTTPQWGFVKRKIVEIKEETPGAIVIVGGPHPTAVPQKCIQDGADFVVIGEGEKTIGEFLLGEKKLDDIAGLVFKGGEFSYRQRMNSEDLNMLPFPARDLVVGYKKHTIVCSRGCPFGCKFCGSANMWGRKTVLRSVDNIEKEVDHLIDKYQMKHLGTRDEIFGLNKKWLSEFCNMISAKGITWEAQTRAKVCEDIDFLNLVKDNGCTFISLGIESGSPKILRSIPKEMPEVNLKAIENIAKCGLGCRGFFIVGLPEETDETIKETEEFILKARQVGLTNISLFTYVPFPGNEFYKQYYSHIEVDDYDDYYAITEKGVGNVTKARGNYDKVTEWSERLTIAAGTENDLNRYINGKNKL